MVENFALTVFPRLIFSLNRNNMLINGKWMYQIEHHYPVLSTPASYSGSSWFNPVGRL